MCVCFFLLCVHPGESENTNTHTQERCKLFRLDLPGTGRVKLRWNLRLFKLDPSGLAFSVPEVLAHKLHMDVCEPRRVGGPGLGGCALDGPGISLYHNYVVFTRIQIRRNCERLPPASRKPAILPFKFRACAWCFATCACAENSRADKTQTFVVRTRAGFRAANESFAAIRTYELSCG